jgi:sec-independent protein translocase protein TatC
MATQSQPPRKESTLGDHLDDLRRAVFRSIIVPFVLVCAIWPFWTDIFIFIRDGLLTPAQIERLASIRALDTFSMSVRLAFYVGMVVSIPWIVWNMWWFIKPGLYPHERKFGRIAIPSSMGLFVIGILFGYFVVIPATLGFLLEFGRDIAPQQIQDVQDLFAAVRFRLLKPELITKHRRAVIMISAILGAVLTPTGDIVTMSVVGAPIYFLIEGGVLIGKVWRRAAERQAAKEPKSILEGFREGLASGVDGEGGMLGATAAEGFGESIRRLSREFAENLKGGIEEFQKDAGPDDGNGGDTGDGQGGADNDEGPSGGDSGPGVTPGGGPGGGGSSGGGGASTVASADAPASPAVGPAAPSASPARAPASKPTIDPAPRAPLDGPVADTPAPSRPAPAAPETAVQGADVPMLPRELRRRIDAYIERRLAEILDDVKSQGTPDKRGE